MVFMTNPTDRGMCCTFNALAAEKIYRESKFSASVASLQKQNVLDSFEYPSPLPPGFDTGEEPSPETGNLFHAFWIFYIYDYFTFFRQK